MDEDRPAELPAAISPAATCATPVTRCRFACVAGWRRRCALLVRGWGTRCSRRRCAIDGLPPCVWTSTVLTGRDQHSRGFRFRHQPHTTAVTHASPAAQLYLSAAMRSRATQDRRRRTPAFALSRCMHQPPPALPNGSPVTRADQPDQPDAACAAASTGPRSAVSAATVAAPSSGCRPLGRLHARPAGPAAFVDARRNR